MLTTQATINSPSHSDDNFRAKIMRKLVVVTQPIYRKFSRRGGKKWTVKTSALLSYPDDSLGYVLGRFLRDFNFSLMAQLESHDVFHVVLGYSPSVLDEARMQYCLLGSGRQSAYALGTCLVAACVYPECLGDFIKHYRRGRGLINFSYWNFEELLPTELDKLRQKIQRVPNSTPDLRNFSNI